MDPNLDALNARLDGIESRLDRLTSLMERQFSGAAPQAATQVAQDLAAVHGPEDLQRRLADTLLRVGDPEVLESLTRILELAPQLEYAAYGLAAGPDLLEEGLEVANEMAEEQGLPAHEVRRRVMAGAELLKGLSSPEQIASLGRLGRMAPSLVPAAEAVESAAQTLVAYEGSAAFQARLSETLVRIGEPEVLDALTRIAALAPQLEYAAYGLAAGPELLEEGLEVANEMAAEQGLDHAELQRRLRAGAALLQKLSTAESIESIGQLGALAPSLVPAAQAAEKAATELEAYEGRDAFQARLAETLVRIGEPEVLESLTAIASMAPRLEYAVYALAAGPELLEEGLDLIKEMSHGGPSMDDRLKAGLVLAEKLSQPATLRGLQSVVEATNQVASSGGFGFLTQAAGMAATGMAAAFNEAGIQDAAQLAPRIDAAMALMVKLSDPSLLGTMERLVDQAIVVEPKLLAATKVLETLDLDALARVTEKATDPLVAEALVDLLDLAPLLRGPLSTLPNQPLTLEMLNRINIAFNEAARSAKPVGAFGALGAMGDPDVQRSVGVALDVARRLGESLAQLPAEAK
ncbi:MAG: DUF1641 domain-containing protein [Myxococcota bacterium]|nr:DUF1641 domain-containing protein [Myxococcota bacterium]